MRRLAVPALALGLALIGTAGTAGTAGARVAPDATTHTKITDSRHDVRRLVIEDGSSKSHFVPDRSRRPGDLTSLRVRYQPGAIVARMRAVSLTKPAGKLLFAGGVMLKTPQPTFTAIVVVDKTGGAVLLNATYSGQDVACPGLHARIGYHSGNVSITIPVSCLGSPRWVRARGVAEYLRFTQKPKLWVDIAPGRTLQHGGLTDRVTPPAGTVTRSVMPRLLPGPSSLSPRIARTLRSIGFLG